MDFAPLCLGNEEEGECQTWPTGHGLWGGAGVGPQILPSGGALGGCNESQNLGQEITGTLGREEPVVGFQSSEVIGTMQEAKKTGTCLVLWK